VVTSIVPIIHPAAHQTANRLGDAREAIREVGLTTAPNLAALFALVGEDASEREVSAPPEIVRPPHGSHVAIASVRSTVRFS